MIQRLIHPFVFRQKFNSKYYSKLKFSEIFNSKKYSKLYFQKYSIQKNIQNFIHQKYSIQKNIHFRISEEIQFKNIIQNWIFSCIQFKEIFIQYKKGIPPRATLLLPEDAFPSLPGRQHDGESDDEDMMVIFWFSWWLQERVPHLTARGWNSIPASARERTYSLCL